MNIARIDLVTLSLFVSVARQGSISAGARQSHLAVGAASKRISDLEAALDTQLLYRNAAGVELTEAGQACLSSCACCRKWSRWPAPCRTLPRACAARCASPPTPRR